MLRYTLRRLAWLPIILFGASLIVFVLLRTLPGQDPAKAVLGQGATQEDYDEYRALVGLDKPLWEQYKNWLGDVVSGEFGVEYRSGRPVSEEFWNRFPATIQIIGLGLFFAVLFGVSFGILSAMYRNGPIDYVVRFFAVLSASIPEFFLLTLYIIIPSYLWNYSQPVGGYQPFLEDPLRYIEHMFPPALIIGIGGAAGLMRLTRTTMLEVLQSDYVRTAKAKGLTQRTVILTHALRNAGTPIVTAIGSAFVAVFAGSIIVENVLSIQGLGQWIFQAAIIRDFPVTQFLALYTALIVILVNLAVDLSYGWIDPRVRYS
jgi:peptide/nickel transport system permease protein